MTDDPDLPENPIDDAPSDVPTIAPSEAPAAYDPPALHCGCHGAPWFVAQTVPSQEAIAFREIAAAGFRVYWPRFVDYRRTSAGKPQDGRVRSLFPGYLFVSFDLSADPWPALFTTRGVLTVLCVAWGRPGAIPAAFVQRLMDKGRAGDGVIDDRAAAFPAHPPIEPGARLRVLSGPFAEFEAVLQMTDRDRVRVLLDVFGRAIPAEMARGNVREIR